MQEIAHCPNMRCNVFSVTKLLLDGWKLGGDQNTTWLDKGITKIKFDIKILTQSGAIFCMYFQHRLTEREISASVIKMHTGAL